jgi:hypothetical protein
MPRGQRSVEFTSEMDKTIKQRMRSLARVRRRRRGDVGKAVNELAASLGVPASAVKSRWYLLRRPKATRTGRVARDGRVGGAMAGTRGAGRRGRAAVSLGAGRGLTQALASYHTALAEVASRRAELARAEAKLSTATTRLSERLLKR